MSISTVFNADCLADLFNYPDNFWDIAIVDVPYGLDACNMNLGDGVGVYRQPKKYKRGDWDQSPPPVEYFQQLRRVSREQIIWGANHFIDRMVGIFPINSPCWVVWDKNNGGSDFADCELAWASFDRPVRKVAYTWSGFIQGRMGDQKEEKIHPTQKPVYLYRWLLKTFGRSRDGQMTHPKILDTHMGSQSSRIAAHMEGFDYWGWEIDPYYFDQGNLRYQAELRKPTLNFPE